jgi:hypothetical protein
MTKIHLTRHDALAALGMQQLTVACSDVVVSYRIKFDAMPTEQTAKCSCGTC